MVRPVIATIVLLVACTAPTPVASPTSSQPAAQSTPSPTGTPTTAPSATIAATPVASPTQPQISAPVSAGAVPEAGIVFFSDYGPPEGQLGARTLYRYDGATGAIRSFSAGPLTLIGASGIAHDTVAGVYLIGLQGRWDLMHWDGTVASDQEFTACQVRQGLFGSWCTVTPAGIGVGYGTHVGPPCGASQFIRYPGDAAGRPIPAEYCVGSAWVNDDGSTVVAGGFVATGPISRGCAADEIAVEFDGTCYRRETWVITGRGSSVRTLRTPALPGSAGDFAISPAGRYAAARHLGSLFMIDLSTGTSTHLGPTATQPRWSTDGRLVFVRGSGRESWADRTVVVAATDGTTREIRGYDQDRGPTSGLAPAWNPNGTRLAWIASPNSAARSDDPAKEYMAGTGIGDRRVLVSDLASDPTEIRCPEGVAEGVRWSHDGDALLLLCRRPNARLNAFDLWFQPLTATAGRAAPLVRGLTLGGVDPLGNTPSLVNTGWSRGLNIGRP